MTYPIDEELVFDDRSLTALGERAEREGKVSNDEELTVRLRALFPRSRPQKKVSFSAPSEGEQRMVEEEKRLIEKAQNGDSKAFDALYKPCQAELFRRCVDILRSKEEAEEATLDAILLSWKNLAGFHGQCRYRIWLLRIGYNRCIDLRRSNQKQFESSQLSLDRLMTDEEGGETTLGDLLPDLSSLREQERTELREAFNVCWGWLTLEERCLLTGVYGGFVTFKDIGYMKEARTEPSAYNTGKYHVRKALENFESLLRKEGISLVGSQALELLEEAGGEGKDLNGLEGEKEQ